MQPGSLQRLRARNRSSLPLGQTRPQADPSDARQETRPKLVGRVFMRSCDIGSLWGSLASTFHQQHRRSAQKFDGASNLAVQPRRTSHSRSSRNHPFETVWKIAGRVWISFFWWRKAPMRVLLAPFFRFMEPQSGARGQPSSGSAPRSLTRGTPRTTPDTRPNTSPMTAPTNPAPSNSPAVSTRRRRGSPA